MKERNRSTGTRVGRSISQAVVLVGGAAAGGFWFRLPVLNRFEALLLAASLPLAVLIGIVLHSRAQTRERWRAAWNAYAEQEFSSESGEPAEEEGSFSWAGTR
jgi:hypothetical protein